ncbi:hypothetical protein [Mucilaginibacter sp.]
MEIDEKEYQAFLKDFQKYRRYQAKLVKLRNAPPNKDNIKPVTALLANITALLKKMDFSAAELIKASKPLPVAVSVKDIDKHYVN